MKITLDPNEIAAVLKDWAHEKYKTQNINIDFHISKETVKAEMEIIMDEQGFSRQQVQSSLIAQAIDRLPDVPDFSPDYAGTSEGI